MSTTTAPRIAARPGQARSRPVEATALLQAPGMPALLTAALLCVGYGVAVFVGEQDPVPPASLIAIALFAALLAAALSRHGAPLPTLNERAATVLRIASVSSFAVELAYFGAPLFGALPYNEFGWPVIHHLAVMHWVLVLFGTRHKTLDLLITVVIATLLFNRQMALFGVLAYLMTQRMHIGRLVAAAAAAIGLMALVGTLRNLTLEVDTASLAETSGLSLGGPLFFLYLYLLGPLHVGLGLESPTWDNYLSVFWNTVPEWAQPAVATGLPPLLSFVLFYGTTVLASYRLRRSKDWFLRVLGSLIHVYLFFTFFSGVLLSTPIIANFLEVAAAGALCVRKRRTP